MLAALLAAFPGEVARPDPRGSSWTMFCKQTFRKLLRAVTWPGGAGLGSVAVGARASTGSGGLLERQERLVSAIH